MCKLLYRVLQIRLISNPIGPLTDPLGADPAALVQVYLQLKLEASWGVRSLQGQVLKMALLKVQVSSTVNNFVDNYT